MRNEECFIIGAASPEPVNEASKKKKGLLANILPLRQAVAQGIRQVAEVAADHVAKYQLFLLFPSSSLVYIILEDSVQARPQHQSDIGQDFLSHTLVPNL